MRRCRRSLRRAARPRARRAAALCALACLALPSAAAAHPSLLTTSPSPGAIGGGPPKRIQLAFSERIEIRGSSLTLYDRAGAKLALGPLTQQPDGPGMGAGVQRDLRPGVYRVNWVVLGDDGHTVGGDFRFGVALPGGRLPPGAASLTASDPGGRGAEVSEGEGALLVAMRWLSLVAAAVLLGGALLVSRIRRRLDDAGAAAIASRQRRLQRWLLAASIVAAAEMLLAAASAGAGNGLDVGVVTASTTGQLTLARLVVVLAAMGAAAVLRGRSREVALAVAGAIVLVTHAIGGHVASLQHDRALAALGQAAHVLGAGVWIGGLLALGLAIARTPASGRRTVAAAGTRALAPVAAGAALVVVVTGTLAALREVDASYFLRWSDYGRVVLGKAGLWLVLVALGAVTLLVVRRGAGGRAGSRLLRVEALVGLAAVVLAATLAGLVQGRGQPLPAQRGNLFAGATFATAPVAKRLAGVTLAPARRGQNHLTAVIGPLQLGQPPVTTPTRVQARLTCACSRRALDVELTQTRAGAWRSAVRLPAEGVWKVRMRLDGRASIAAIPVSVGAEDPPGAPPLQVASIASLSGPDAQRCRAHELGLLVALAVQNVQGGVDGGRKLVQLLYDDEGSPARAAALAGRLRRRGDVPALVAPCGPGAPSAVAALDGALPAIVADPAFALGPRKNVLRLAPDPYSEGYALAQEVVSEGFRAFPGGPRRIAALVPADRRGERAVAGLRAGLKAQKATRSGVQVFRHDGSPSGRQVLRAIDGQRFIATYVDGDQDALAGSLNTIGRRDDRIVPAAIFTSSRLFSERFQVDSGLLGRIGSLRSVAEVSPAARDALSYSNLVQALYPGERPSIDGLRGYLAGRALARALADGGGLAEKLAGLGRFSDALSSGWPRRDPAAGSQLVGFFLPTFLPSGLIRPDQGGEEVSGSYFPNGSWKQLTSNLYGPGARIEAPRGATR